jgi:hypothetical protein
MVGGASSAARAGNAGAVADMAVALPLPFWQEGGSQRFLDVSSGCAVANASPALTTFSSG